MASGEAMNGWTALRIAWTLWWIGEGVAITIIDYPNGAPLWDALTGCSVSAGWIHEVFYMFVGWAVVMDLTYWWEDRKKPKRFRVLRTP